MFEPFASEEKNFPRTFQECDAQKKNTNTRLLISQQASVLWMTIHMAIDTAIDTAIDMTTNL